jgi:inner membrane transporter RhtA
VTHPTAARATLVPVVLVIVAMASIQTGAAIAKRLFPMVGSTGAAALRLLFAAVILCVVLRPWRVRLDGAAWRAVLVYGIALGGMNSLFYASIRTVPLGVATAFEITGPLTVAVLSSRRAVDFLWIALAVAGLLLLLPLREAAAGVDPVGAAFALGAGACWALYILFGKKAGAGLGVQATALAMVVGALCVLPFGIASAGARLLTPAAVPYAVAVAVLSTALPYSLEMISLRRLPARTFGTLMSLQPAFAALSGLVLLHERLGATEWVAIATIIAASVGTTLTASAGGAADDAVTA